jgi:hypothetical protein
MKRVACPFCNQDVVLRSVFFEHAKPFCQACGWNLSAARAGLPQLENNVVAFGVLFTLCTLGSLAVFFAAKSAGTFLVEPAFGFLFFICAWIYWHEKRAIEDAVRSGRIDPRQAGSTPLPSLPTQKIQALAKPRRITLRPAGVLLAAFLLLAILATGVVLAFLLQNLRGMKSPANSSGLLPVFCLLAVISVALAVAAVKERRRAAILRDGEVAQARIISQQTVRRGRATCSDVVYEFRSPSGQLIRKTARDRTWTVYEDMFVPVFFPLGKAEDSIALFSTYCRLRDLDS